MAISPTIFLQPRVQPRLTVFGLVVSITGIGAAFGAQYLLTPLGKVTEGLILYAVATLLTVIGVSLTERVALTPAADPVVDAQGATDDDRDAAGRSGVPGATVRVIAGGLGVSSLAAIASTIYLLEVRKIYDQAFWLWVASLLLLVASLAIGAQRRIRLRPPQLTLWHTIELAAIIAILVLAVTFRLPDLVQIPPEVHGDEAAVGLEARRILRGEVENIFGVGWYDIPYLSFGIPAVFMELFGDNLYSLRFASVVQGTLSIMLLYLIVKKLFSVRIAVVAAFLMAVSHWHIHFSRSGISYMQAVFAGLLLYYFLLRGLETRRAMDFGLAGIAIGLCMNVYFAARLVPVIAGLYILHRILTEQGFVRRYRTGLLALVLGTLLFLAPSLAFYAKNPLPFFTRAQGVLVFSPRNLEHAYASYKVDRVEDVLWLQTERTLLAFNLRGESSMQHAHRAPLLDFWTSALFVPGLALTTLRPQRARFFFLASWFWLTLLTGSVLTIDAPFSPHIIGVIPATVVFSALVIDAGWRSAGAVFGRAGTYAFALPIAAVLLLAVRANYYDYFELHIKKHQPAGFYTVLSSYITSINDRYRVYLIGKDSTSLRYDTPHFLLPDVDGVDVRNEPLTLPLDRVPRTKGVAFLVEHNAPDAAHRLAAIKQVYANGNEQLHKTVTGVPLFYSYQVERDRLLTAKPDALVDTAPIPALRPSQLNDRATPSPAPMGTAPRFAEGKPILRIDNLGEPREVAVDTRGVIYVVDRERARVDRIDPNGHPLGAIGEDDDGRLSDPRAIALAPDGNVLVLDAASNVVQTFTPDGKRVSTLQLPGSYFPSGLAVGPNGTVFVADTGRSRVLQIETEGTVRIIGRDGDDRSKLDQPTDVSPGPDGEIYVVDTGKRRIVVFDSTRTYQREWPIQPAGTLHGPHLAVTERGILVTEPETGSIVLYDVTGRQHRRLDASELSRPVGVTVDDKGALYVADVVARSVLKYMDWYPCRETAC